MSSAILSTLFRVAWRRRYLILVPLLILLPATVLLALKLPRPYESSALLMLQEASALRARTSGFTYSQEMEGKVKGLRALLMSQYVLSKVVRDELGADASPVEVARQTEELRKQVSLEKVGVNFVKIAVRGKPQEVKERLTTVLARLFEVLLNPAATDTTNAQSFLAGTRVQQVTRLEAQLRTLEKANPGVDQNKLVRLRTERQSLAVRYQTKTSERENAQSELTKRITEILGAVPEGGLPAAITETTSQLETLNKSTTPDRAAIAATEKKLAQLKALMPLDAKIAALSSETGTLLKAAEAKAAEIARFAGVIEQRDALLTKLTAAKQAYNRVLAGLKALNQRGALDILSAPAQVRIVDPPADPIKPLTSALKILVAGALAAILLSLGLAQLAELIDTSIRGAGHLASIAEVPIIARINNRLATNGGPRANDSGTSDDGGGNTTAFPQTARRTG